MKAILQRDSCNYVTYDNSAEANIAHEKFWLQKKLFGIVIYRKRWRQDSSFLNERAIKKTGFK